MDGTPNPAYALESVAIDDVGIQNGKKNNVVNGKGGSVMSAHNINYSVKVRTKCCTLVEKQILHSITGIFRPGMNAILGPSGSGKSSFLDVLAGRVDRNLIKGQLLLDGQPVPDNFKCMVGYVVQDDVVMGTLSVRENFAFSAALRLPASVSSRERENRVDQVIKELDLEKCADTKVGNQFIRGVSGGERKRCNIGMELIISPPVLYLDEPTTGLDASTANTLLLYLKRLSRRNRTIIFSIHQPRYSIYRLFDNLMLLSAGHTVFHGPAKEALDFFTQQGFVCHEHNNPPDFFLDVINGDPASIRQEAADGPDVDLTEMEGEAQHDKLVEAFRRSSWNKNVQNEASGILAGFDANGPKKWEKERIDYATSFGRQLSAVMGRAVKNIIRNPQNSILTVVTSVIFGLIVSAIFWQLDEDPLTGINDRAGVIFFLIVNTMFQNMAAVEVFIHERVIFMHENISGFYRVSVYFLVKVFFDLLPLRLLPLIIQALIVYFAIGLNLTVVAFFKFVFTLLCLSMCATSVCFLISSSIRIFAVAQSVLTLVYVLMMLFAGFFVNLGSIGVWLNWAKHFSIVKYALSALYINEFDGRNFCPSNATITDCRTGNDYLEQREIDNSSNWDFWKNHVGLIIYTVILLALTYVQLRRMKKHK